VTDNNTHVLGGNNIGKMTQNNLIIFMDLPIGLCTSWPETTDATLASYLPQRLSLASIARSKPEKPLAFRRKPESSFHGQGIAATSGSRLSPG